jgi:transposase
MDWDYTHTKARNGEKVQEKRRMYLHLYYDEQRATDEKIRFNERLDLYEEELLSGQLNKKHENQYQQYFEIIQTPVRGKKIVAKEEAIEKKLTYSGYFALISNSISDPLEAIDIYRSKDVIEKAYGDLKSRLSLRRTSVSSEEALEGKLFVQFVALIIVSYIKKQMDEKGLFKKYTLQEVLDELDVIECFQQPASIEFLGEVTLKQKKLFEDLGFDSILS